MKKFLFAFALLVSSIALAQSPSTPAANVPRCMVDQFAGNFHTATTAFGDTVAFLWCDDQVGLDWWIAAGPFSPSLPTPACLSSLPAPSWSLVFLKALWTACASANPLNDDQNQTASVMFAQFLPRLAVTGPAPQNLYTLKADGSKGPQLIIGGFGMQVAPGTPCFGKRIQNAGSRYHQLGGKQTTNGQVIPANTFAICTITYPPAGGFPTT